MAVVNDGRTACQSYAPTAQTRREGHAHSWPQKAHPAPAEATEDVAMSLSWRKSKRVGKGLTLNMSKSGPSLSQRLGPFSVSSRGRVSLRLGKGLTWRGKL